MAGSVPFSQPLQRWDGQEIPVQQKHNADRAKQMTENIFALGDIFGSGDQAEERKKWIIDS
ncbi:hypothetical protein [Paenibacillus ginsengihumi]|uniref:hypothetical protein n=1 Tax=Paenibacillus ginsengihumi TaxID=431596 RepID=UPI00036CD0BF|nr:hypothetical protein [Paenibacillus ginsengihumi]